MDSNYKPYRAPSATGVVTLAQMQSAIQQGDYQQLKILLTRFNLGKFAPHRQDVHVWSFLNEAVTRRYPLIVKLLLAKFNKVNFPTNVGKPLILTAVQQGNIEIIAALAEFGADVNVSNYGTTPLFQALTSGFMSGVECLLQKGADPNTRGERSETPLHFAVKQGNLELLYCLLENGANLNVHDTFKQTPLHLAVKGGNFEMVKFMIGKEADVNIRGKSNQTPLHLAVEGGNFEMVKFLVEKGANVNAQDDLGQTSLHSALGGGNFEIVKFLFEKDADLNIHDGSGLTLLHFAVTNKNLKIFQFILEKWPHVNAQDNLNQTPLHIAVEKGNLEFVKLLLDQGANFEAATISGKRPLHLAASNNRLEISICLLEKGAYVNAADEEQKTPLLAAIKPNNEGIVKLLVSRGADINVQTSSNENLLHCASSVDLEILKFLLQMDLDVNFNDDNGRTPLFYAAKHNKLENVQILLKHGARLSTEDKDHKDMLELAYESTPEILELILECHPNLYFRGEGALAHFFHLASVQDDNSEHSDYSDYWDEEEKKEEREIYDLKNIVFLVERGLDANMEITYQSVESTLLFHAMKKSYDLVVRLLEAGAKVNLASSYSDKSYDDEYYYRRRRHWDSEDEYENKEFSPLYAVILAEAYDHYGFQSESRLVTTLLQYGADVNDLPDEFDERFSRGYLSLDRNLREFIRHIALVENQVLEFDEFGKNDILDVISADFPQFYNECKKEIEKLKTEQFGETSLSFFEVLTKSATQLAEFLRNKSVIDELEAAEYEDQFPIYGTAITSQLAMGLRRRKLLDKAAQNCYTVFPCLPRLVSEEIFSYLGNKDVRVLLLACQAAKSRPWIPKQ